MQATGQAGIDRRIADELGVREGQVSAAVGLLDGGATVPFIARYRKEVTGTLDDAQLRTLEERLRYLRELDERRAAILESIRSQGKLTTRSRRRSLAADTKARLEDIYLPFKPKRRTKAQIAREAGLEPLADLLLSTPSLDPATAAGDFIARHGSRTPPRRWRAPGRSWSSGSPRTPTWSATCASCMWTRGRLVSAGARRARRGGGEVRRLLRLRRAAHQAAVAPHPGAVPRREGGACSTVDLDPDGGAAEPVRGPRSPRRFGIADRGRPADRWLLDTVRWAWRTRMLVQLDIDLRMRLRQRGRGGGGPGVRREPARPAAGRARPAPAPTMGLDPGFRTGVKVAVVDAHRQGGRHRHHLPARAAAAVGRVAGDAGPAGPRAPGRADRHRQRHRLPRDRQAGRRARSRARPTST